MKASFVIPHRKNLAMIQAAVGSIQRLVTPENWSTEIIVVDNGSTEGTAEWARSAGCRAIRLEQNEGFGRAVNRGMNHSNGDLIVVMNDDVELEPDWLTCSYQALETAPQLWFTSGKTLAYANREQIDGAGDAICQGGVSVRLGHGRQDGSLFQAARQTYFPSGTVALFRRGFFDEIGPFDEMYFAYLEDVDLGLRAALAGLSGAYAPQARAYHHGSQTGTAWSPAMVRWVTGHQILLLAKFYPGRLLLRFGWKIVVAQSLWAALAISRGRAASWVQGIVLGLRRLRQARRTGKHWRERSDRLPEILARSEAELERFQRETGFDSYWKWYFRLTGGPKGEQR